MTDQCGPTQMSKCHKVNWTFHISSMHVLDTGTLGLYGYTM